jgi:CheY-like chemotaxis protein
MPRQILVVDNDELYVMLVREVFTMKGHSVLSASNGAEGLKILESNPVDLIVSDVEMPVMDGLEFHSKVRQDPRFQSTPFAFLSGTTRLEVLRELRKKKDVVLVNKAEIVDQLLSLFGDIL